ncbi:MAG TPA: FMN-binding protein [Candidatus Saccharimonadales bacterium]|nr:FMN-binding protein [Candidatus Saccharimonadales bacterium]
MKRTIVIILTIAVLGLLSLYAKDRQQSSSNLPQRQTPTASSGVQPISGSPAQPQSATFKDGVYSGSSQDTPYGTVQVAVIVSGGKITSVNFLQMPNDQHHSEEVTAFSEPILRQETLVNQSSNIEFVSGATSTSFGYQESLQAALDQARIS